MAGLGGRGLTSTIVAAEVPPTCHPLGPNNKLVIAPGLLSGTAAANSSRISIGAKSPLTGTIKESNAGGTAAQLLAKCGCKAIIVEGQPVDDKWYGVALSSEGVTITEESELIGKSILKTEKGFNEAAGFTNVDDIVLIVPQEKIGPYTTLLQSGILLESQIGLPMGVFLSSLAGFDFFCQ